MRCQSLLLACLPASFGIRIEKNDFHIFYCCCCRCCLFVVVACYWLTGRVDSASWRWRMLEWEMRENYCLCLAFIWFHIPLTAYDSFSISHVAFIVTTCFYIQFIQSSSCCSHHKIIHACIELEEKNIDEELERLYLLFSIKSHE